MRGRLHHLELWVADLGGPDHRTAYLADVDVFEVDLVASPGAEAAAPSRVGG